MHHRPHGDHACASCKHQRKKCKEDCMMAPFFPVQNNKQFRAVHKIFGVSNVAKQLKKHSNEEHRRLSADSLIWEASCWEDDPIHGPYGEYRRVLEELNHCKTQFCRLASRLPAAASQGSMNLAYNQPPPAAMVPNGVLINGWSNSSATAGPNPNKGGGGGNITVMDNINGGLLSSVADYHDQKGNLRVDNVVSNVQFAYSGSNNHGIVQDLEVQTISGPQPLAPSSLEQVIQSIGDQLQDQRDRSNGVILPQRQQQQQQHPMASFNQQFFTSAGQYHPTSDANPSDMDSSKWTGNSQ